MRPGLVLLLVVLIASTAVTAQEMLFDEVEEFELEFVRDAALIDMTGDGIEDLVLVREAREDLLFAGNSSGNLTLVENGSSTAGVSMALGDFDGDDRVDVAVGSVSMENDVWLNKVGGMEVERAISDNRGWDIAAGDLDGDGRDDLVLVTDTELELYHNDAVVGEANFTRQSPSPFATGRVDRIAIIDLIGSTALDVVVASGTEIRIFENNGTMGTDVSFEESLLLDEQATVLEVVDWDGDGTDDLLVGTSTSEWVIPPRSSEIEVIGADATSALSLGDVDGDGDIDLLSIADGDSSWLDDNNTTYNRWNLSRTEVAGFMMNGIYLAINDEGWVRYETRERLTGGQTPVGGPNDDMDPDGDSDGSPGALVYLIAVPIALLALVLVILVLRRRSSGISGMARTSAIQASSIVGIETRVAEEIVAGRWVPMTIVITNRGTVGLHTVQIQTDLEVDPPLEQIPSLFQEEIHRFQVSTRFPATGEVIVNFWISAVRAADESAFQETITESFNVAQG